MSTIFVKQLCFGLNKKAQRTPCCLVTIMNVEASVLVCSCRSVCGGVGVCVTACRFIDKLGRSSSSRPILSYMSSFNGFIFSRHADRVVIVCRGHLCFLFVCARDRGQNKGNLMDSRQ